MTKKEALNGLYTGLNIICTICNCRKPEITDDAMVVERYSDIPVKMVESSYNNIKVTTQGDIDVVEAFLVKKAK